MVMALAVLMYVLVRWSKNEPAINIATIISGVIVVGVIALLDNGKTAEIARGFSWLFFIVVAYNFVPALTSAAKAAGAATKSNVQDTLT